MRPFGCLVTILNTPDSLGKFNGKVDEGFLVGYSVSSKAFRVFNNRARIVQETLHVNFLENKPDVAGSGPTWLFDIDTLTKTMNYQPVTTSNQSSPSASVQDQFDDEKAGEEIKQKYVLFPVWSSGSINPQNTDGDAAFDEKELEIDEKKPESEVNVSSSSSAQSKKQYDKTKREAKGKIPTVGQIFPNSTNTFSVAGPLKLLLAQHMENLHRLTSIISLFAELARMGYKRPSTKLTFTRIEFSSSMTSANICLSSGRKSNFSKYIFDSLVRNVDSPTKFYMYPCFLQLMIRKQVIDLSTHTTKYTSPALTQKVFANMRRVGKGFSRVETPLFEGMFIAQEVEEGDADENVEDVNAGVAAEGVVSAADDVVPTATKEPSIPSPTPPTLPPQPSHDIPSTSQDKIAQALKITKLKQRVKKLKRRNKVKVLKLRRMIADMDAEADVVLEEAKDVADDAKDGQDADVQVNADIQGRTAESQAEIYKINLDHANKVLRMHEEESDPAELQEVVDIVTTTKIITEVVTTASTTITATDVLIPTATTVAALKLIAAPSRRTKGVVIRDPEESTTTTSIIIHSEAKSKDKEFKEKHAKCLMLLVKDLVLSSQDDVVD
nr:retrovirus-related Pol polyprotein from transposon TNT 1-94 [Tanacetum cinerariifolium]